jgi:hypothetical protein
VKLHSYVVARDYGFAPNPFFGVCTLATCKPEIRRVAQIGDWVVGTGSKKRKRDKNIVYAMRVTEAMTFNQYWSDPRFQAKKPNLRGSKKQAFGDNIYSKDAHTTLWCQANSHHSLTDGHPERIQCRRRHERGSTGLSRPSKQNRRSSALCAPDVATRIIFHRPLFRNLLLGPALLL